MTLNDLKKLVDTIIEEHGGDLEFRDSNDGQLKGLEVVSRDDFDDDDWELEMAQKYIRTVDMTWKDFHRKEG